MKVKKDPVDVDFEKHMHAGHRGRVLKAVNAGGLDHFSEIQILEYILFFIFPRGDVNPLAHRLLQRFGRLCYVLDASVQDLMRVKGMGETSAMKLHSLLAISDCYNLDKLNATASLEALGDMIDGVEILLRNKNEELCYIFGVSPSGKICNSRIFAHGDISNVKFDVNEIHSYISSFKVNGVFFAHNHPHGSCIPSEQDLKTFEQLRNYLAYSGCKLYDSLIVGKDGVFSCARKSIRRNFTETITLEELGIKEIPEGKPEE